MKFGLFYELQLPRPWRPDDEYKLYKNTLDQIELADRLGFDCIWTVEHHFLEYSHCSAPEVLLAAASQRTKRIRLGHGIVQLPNEINPTRASPSASRRSTCCPTVVSSSVPARAHRSPNSLDSASIGTQSVTSGRAISMRWTRMMVEEPFAGWESKWLNVPPRNVVPKPLQKPHPPLWVACSQPTIQLAASKGVGALSSPSSIPRRPRATVDSYYSTITSGACDPAGFAINANVAIVLPLMCHSDEQTALDYAACRVRCSSASPSATSMSSGRNTPEPPTSGTRSSTASRAGSATPGSKLANQDLGDSKSTEKAGDDLLRGAIGTPERIRDVLGRYEAAGVDQVIFLAQAGRTQHGTICESLELFAPTSCRSSPNVSRNGRRPRTNESARRCKRRWRRRRPAAYGRPELFLRRRRPAVAVVVIRTSRRSQRRTWTHRARPARRPRS